MGRFLLSFQVRKSNGRGNWTKVTGQWPEGQTQRPVAAIGEEYTSKSLCDVDLKHEEVSVPAILRDVVTHAKLFFVYHVNLCAIVDHVKLKAVDRWAVAEPG